MTAPDRPALTGMSIGSVLDLLRPEFPDVTISKIRFLESEGLVTPSRSASGYRRFSAYDAERLRFILTAQRDHYLPLKVIKEQLDAQPDGALPDVAGFTGGPRLFAITDGDSTNSVARQGIPSTRPTRLSREDLLSRSGADEVLLTSLIKAGIITAGPGGFFDEYTVLIVQCAAELADYGVEPRHLRTFRSAVDRETDLIAQIVGPTVKANKAGARDRADDLIREVAALSIALHGAMIKSAVRGVLDR
ncbi:MerR family transcriptional regulator [Mycobacteroides chelonae]|uniref:MerR family transcriptional regulator n=2 Tax=Mycobacteroides TaxID=670516 RepID=A0A1S1JD21_9MYCO|nr:MULTISPECIES: MerR family transcriptional regulator [Mycobacteroides]PKQ59545.1 MerR family transcriptional regulator [Mycobacterium sp. MHSD3]SKM81710.1 HTH-type transcriptional regulator [Mycobacteroides abscessus subsp. bolletii]VEG16673.1 HTH-type transcriptional regulator [Mycolicibacterium phlei]ALR11881.1 MerR family transcriptional regulator [Mycobacteroides saopaulense]ANA98405.1 MerR family transcriptional regulator [Mycobacteroides chelonae CCUG 47445]